MIVTRSIPVDFGVELMLTKMAVVLSPVSIGGFLETTVDPYIRGRAKNRFSSQGDDASGKWHPLSEVTQRIRGDAGYGASGPINIRTGELAEYITGTPGGISPNSQGVTLTSPGTPPSGELAVKVQTAQYGKKYPQTIARPVMGLSETDVAAVLTELAQFIVTRVAL